MSTINGFKDFVGQTIEKVLRHQSNGSLLFRINQKWYLAEAVGECCSSSWFEHCDNAEAFDNAIFQEYFDFDQGSFEDNADYSNSIRINMLKFKTSKGYCTIEFRNSSNGYYSGYVVFTEMDFQPEDYRLYRDPWKPLEDF